MGIPVELRLRIYHHLFAPRRSSHCCLDRSNSILARERYTVNLSPQERNASRTARRDLQLKPVCYDCRPIGSARILTTCRTIFAEAMPVLYGETQFKAQAPFYPVQRDHRDDPRDVAQLTYENFNFLDRIPVYGPSHIRTPSVILDEPIIGREGAVSDYLPRFWTELQSRCPKLERVRIHIDISIILHQLPTNYFSRMTDLLQTVGKIATVKEDVVVVHRKGVFMDPDVEPLWQGLVDAVEMRAY